MPLDIRAFCTSPTVPTLAQLQQWLTAQGSAAFFADDLDDTAVAHAPAASLDDPDWRSTALSHSSDEQSILVECNRDDGTDACMCRQDANDFIERIGPPGRSKKKQRIIDHLRATKFVLYCQIPFSDEETERSALSALEHCVTYLFENCGGLAHVEDHGFVDTAGLVLRDA
jgi:hypothetical protein